MLSAILFAACFSNKTSLIALVATDCPSLLNQSHWNFFMIQAQYVSIIYHIKDPPVVFSPRLFALSLLQLEVDLIHIDYCFNGNRHFQAIHNSERGGRVCHPPPPPAE